MAGRARNQQRNGGSYAARSTKTFSRDIVILILFLLVAIYIVCGLVYVQVFKSAEYSDIADSQHIKTNTLVAKRGTIYDRNGEILASSIDSVTINVNPNDIDYSTAVSENDRAMLPDPAEAVATIFEEYLGEEYDKTYDDYYDLVTKENTAYVIIQRKADADIVEKMKAALKDQNLQGVYYEEDSTRVYPNGETGSQVVGTVGLKLVDAEGKVVDESTVTDTTGLTESYRGTSGLELYYDELLAGTDGSVSQEKSDSGIPVAGGSITMKEAEDGEDMIISLDIKLQQKAEKALKTGLKKYKAQGGSVTVMDASTGEIYAAASYTKKTGSKTQKYTYQQDAGKLWTVSDSYEPGSTFKTLTAVAVMAKGGVTAKSAFSVPSVLKVYDHKITDSHAHGNVTMSFKQIIAESSNIGTVKASRTVGNSVLYMVYNKFGFGKDCGIDFPGVATGELEKPKDWDGVQRATITFGQGLLVSGMQLVRAYGAIEQGGPMHTPHFLTSLPNNEELEEELVGELEKTKKTCKEKTAKKVTELLKAVTKNGTGTAARIKGYTVAGKTGTAEIAKPTGGYLKNAYQVSFIGWLDDTDSDLICLVTMDRPQTEEGGGPVCGPIFAEIMSFAADRYQVSNLEDN